MRLPSARITSDEPVARADVPNESTDRQATCFPLSFQYCWSDEARLENGRMSMATPVRSSVPVKNERTLACRSLGVVTWVTSLGLSGSSSNAGEDGTPKSSESASSTSGGTRLGLLLAELSCAGTMPAASASSTHGAAAADRRCRSLGPLMGSPRRRPA